MSPSRAPERLSGIVVYGRQAAEYTTWGVGGRPFCTITPGNQTEAADSLRWLTEEGIAFDVLGGGSNVLIADGEISAALFHTRRLCDVKTSLLGSDVLIECGAGAALGSVFALAKENGWSGLEFAVGIPGTVGGAILGNAGTSSGDMSGIVHEVQTLDGRGSLTRMSVSDITWSYRCSSLTDDPRKLLYAACIKLSVSTGEKVARAVADAAANRKDQPRGAKTAGCVFKNPPGNSAGKLLDMCGCKGMTIGGARVSAAHANFIENFDECRAEDILSLAQLCRKRVHETYGVMLEYEIKFIGIPEERLRVF